MTLKPNKTQFRGQTTQSFTSGERAKNPPAESVNESPTVGNHSELWETTQLLVCVCVCVCVCVAVKASVRHHTAVSVFALTSSFSIPNEGLGWMNKRGSQSVKRTSDLSKWRSILFNRSFTVFHSMSPRTLQTDAVNHILCNDADSVLFRQLIDIPYGS